MLQNENPLTEVPSLTSLLSDKNQTLEQLRLNLECAEKQIELGTHYEMLCKNKHFKAVFEEFLFKQYPLRLMYNLLTDQKEWAETQLRSIAAVQYTLQSFKDNMETAIQDRKAILDAIAEKEKEVSTSDSNHTTDEDTYIC